MYFILNFTNFKYTERALGALNSTNFHRLGASTGADLPVHFKFFWSAGTGTYSRVHDTIVLFLLILDFEFK